MPISHKINRVPDSICQPCSQLFDGECRAYEMPHSAKEREHRETAPPKCASERQKRFWNEIQKQ